MAPRPLEQADGGRYDGQYPPEFSRLYRDPDLLWVTPFPVRYIIGVIGARCSGKSTVLSYLSDKKGFEVYSMSALVRQEAERLGLPVEGRSTLQNLGDELRAGHRPPGPLSAPYGDGGYLARKMLRQVHHRFHRHGFSSASPPRIAVSGFKHPAELEVFRGLRQFQILWLHAELNDRARRAQRTELLSREIREAGREGLTGKIEPDGEPREDLFREYLDDRDQDGRTDHPWAGEYAQAVARLLSLTAEIEHSERSEQLDDGRRTLTKLSNGIDVKLNQLYAEVDGMVKRLDLRFRVGRI
jgi:AAA domain